ncbi:MAG: ABC transporter ATP-binding protein [Holosporales bacterium]|jgi:ABC-2 type transport system ATP-binding protein|nr:ABC transporter ATP-binding protein [Holosporales bacterium]
MSDAGVGAGAIGTEFPPIVDVKNLNVVFGSFFAVKDVSFFVNKGEIFGFLGANGAGKTTTIRVICGLICATSGEVRVDNEHFIPGKEDIIKSKVGYMSQKFTLYKDLTIKENLDFAAAIHNVPKKAMQKTKQELFELIKIDRGESDLVAELPSGIKQQVALVAALIHNPKLVVLDEPTAGVSPASRAHFWDLIKRLTQIGKTVFVTTHYMDEAENCDRIALMRSGELIAVGSVPELKRNTFKRQIYSVTPKTAFTEEQIQALSPKCDLFKPYGIHYHVILKDDQYVAELERVAEVVMVEPSLEDVFVQLVEGDR